MKKSLRNVVVSTGNFSAQVSSVCTISQLWWFYSLILCQSYLWRPITVNKARWMHEHNQNTRISYIVCFLCVCVCVCFRMPA